jgi:2-C-methyl-D-erythritol 4-phosphate cytidylyltransferase
MSILAIITAAGSGSRMGGNTPKQFLTIGGRPILLHTLEKIAAAPEVEAIYLTARSADFDFIEKEILVHDQLHKVHKLVPGGRKRQDSVYNALKTVNPRYEYIMVHDGVRPFVSLEQISAVIREARRTGAAILGIPARDTIKEVGANHLIQRTLDRENLVLVQTPQVFRRDWLLLAFEQAYRNKRYGTDEAYLLELQGYPVAVVPGDPYNLKITHPGDLEWAESYLKRCRGQ